MKTDWKLAYRHWAEQLRIAYESGDTRAFNKAKQKLGELNNLRLKQLQN